MNDDLAIVLDAGTGGGRAAAVNKEGKIVARRHLRWSFDEDPGAGFNALVFDPEVFKTKLEQACREVVAETGRDSVKAVTATSMRQGCLFLGEDDSVIYAGPNTDARGVAYANEIEEIFGRDRAYSITGKWPPWIFPASRLLWLKLERPADFARLARVVMIGDWIIHMLSGAYFSEHTNACETMLYDTGLGEWSAELIGALGLSPDLFPKTLEPGAVAGEVTALAAASFGLPEGVPVVMGMADSQAALLAAGVADPGQCAIVAGTTAPLMAVMDAYHVDTEERRLWIGRHPLAERWVAESNAGEAGSIYRGFVEGFLGRFAGAGEDVYSAIDAEMLDIEPGANGAMAFMGPCVWDLENMDPAARAGMSFVYPPRPENAGPAAVGRALLENIAFAMKANLAQLEKFLGPMSKTALAGGMVRSASFRRVLADVLAREIEVVGEAEATAVGAAMAAFAGAGTYASLGDAARAMKAESAAVGPGEDNAEEYGDLFEDWLEQYGRMMHSGEDW